MIASRRIAQGGFTLLEMSIVLGIIALIAGAGMKMAGGALKAADRITTQERLATIKTALDSYSKTYGYLPCPATRNRPPTSTGFGIELRATIPTTTCNASPPGVVYNPPVWFGAVPVRTLGLPDYYAADAWGNKFTYAVSDMMVTRPTATSYNAGGITVRYGTRALSYSQTMQRSSVNYTFVDNNGTGYARFTITAGTPPASGTIVHLASSANPPVYKGSFMATYLSPTQFSTFAPYTAPDTSGTVEWQEPGANAAYVVVSHGPDGRGAFPLASTAIPGNKLCNTSVGANTSPPPCTSSATTSCIDIENCNEDSVFFDTAYNDGTQPVTYFDDYIVWGSNDLQRMPVNNKLYTSCPATAGACESWCALCTTNYPGGTGTAPPPALSTTPPNVPFLYKKVLNSDSTTCSATCFWSGLNGTNYVGAP